MNTLLFENNIPHTAGNTGTSFANLPQKLGRRAYASQGGPGPQLFSKSSCIDPTTQERGAGMATLANLFHQVGKAHHTCTFQ